MDVGVICCFLFLLKEEDLWWVVLNLNILDCVVYVGMFVVLWVCVFVLFVGVGWVVVVGVVWVGG